jgi:hypothetical protein
MFGVAVHVGDSDGRGETLLLKQIGQRWVHALLGEAGKLDQIRRRFHVILAENITLPIFPKKAVWGEESLIVLFVRPNSY